MFVGINRVDFQVAENKPITLILGDNATGNTTIFKPINWILFGTLNKDDLLSKGFSEGYAMATFGLYGDNYMVKRTLNLNDSMAYEYVEIHKNGKLIDTNDEKMILDYICDRIDKNIAF